MTFKNIVTKRTYIKDGEEKTIWLQVGTLKQLDDGRQFIELNIFPNTDFYVFDKEDKNHPNNSQNQAVVENNSAQTSEEISVEDIPF